MTTLLREKGLKIRLKKKKTEREADILKKLLHGISDTVKLLKRVTKEAYKPKKIVDINSKLIFYTEK